MNIYETKTAQRLRPDTQPCFISHRCIYSDERCAMGISVETLLGHCVVLLYLLLIEQLMGWWRE